MPEVIFICIKNLTDCVRVDEARSVCQDRLVWRSIHHVYNIQGNSKVVSCVIEWCKLPDIFTLLHKFLLVVLIICQAVFNNNIQRETELLCTHKYL